MFNDIDLDAIDTTAPPPTEEPARQYYFMAKCREWVKEFERKNGRRSVFFTQTFGCPFVRVKRILQNISKHKAFPGKEKLKNGEFTIQNRR